jgi:hypothetical protein
MSWATEQAGGNSASAAGDDQSALAELHWHWGVAYEISLAEDGWAARRRTGTSLLAGSSADELLRLIRADYAENSARRSPECDSEAGERERPEPGPGERALRRLLDDGII